MKRNSNSKKLIFVQLSAHIRKPHQQITPSESVNKTKKMRILNSSNTEYYKT